ncbi:MAG: non-canonical purine NTP pyrophosphatase [Pedosphaera sp. Tous-C6FEB]|nr:MAG: non-canonical purine NTP pyrophosphatase [Pedosphaera sp. Tous-C6FEB]
MTTLLIATRNAHKVGEIQTILGAGFRCRALLQEFPDAPVPVEDADSFAGNAVLKARSLADWLASLPAARELAAEQAWVLADDSGLEVDVLGGAPGIHSARFAALDSASTGNSPDRDNNAKLLRLLAGVPVAKRSARFRCALALVPVGRADAPQIFEGTCEGRIDLDPRGAGGFGYDPLFIPAGREQSFAELGEETKSRISHRSQALGTLRARFSGGK